MTPSLKTAARHGLVVACASILIAGIGYVFAAPTAAPPGSTIPLPLTRGSGSEVKAGALTIQGLLTASAGLSVTGSTTTGTLNATTICLGGDCKTAWPSGGGGTATANGADYHPSYNCYSYNNYNQLTFYYNGYQYSNQYAYNCNNVSYAVTVPSTIASGKTVSAVVGGTVWCHASGSDFNGYSPSSTYITDSYYPNRIAGTVASVVNNNNGTVTVNGTCRFIDYNGYGYVYMAMRVDNLTLLTN